MYRILIASVGLLLNYVDAATPASPTTTPAVIVPEKKTFSLPDYYEKYTLSFGDPNAPIKVHEFFSFSCPSCVMFYKHHFPVIQQQLIDSGKVYWTFVPYVMDVDTLYVMAIAGVCETDMKRKIFEAVMESALNWTDDDNKDNIMQLIRSMGISEDVVQSTYSESNYECVLRESFDFQEHMVVDGTPTLFINGEEVPGIPSAKKLTKLLHDALANQPMDANGTN